MKAVQYRIARPTLQLQKITQFYTEALGLKLIGSFTNHDGYDGVMIGFPDKRHHLEFIQHQDPEAIPAPTKEHMLVFYFDKPDEYANATERLQKLGNLPMEPENPYWLGKSETYEDPDRWRIVLFNGVYTP